VNNCDGEKMEDKFGRVHFQKQWKQCFDIFKISEKMLDLFQNIVKEIGEGNIGSIFSYVY